MRHVFISPHLDDAIISVGSFLLKLKQDREEIQIITVFSSFGDGEVSQQSKRYVKESGCETSSDFEKERVFEDNAAMKLLGIDGIKLEYIDAGFRKKQYLSAKEKCLVLLRPEIRFVYPDSRSIFSGRIDKGDESLVSDITGRLKKIVGANDVVYCPLGYGGHVDHLIVRSVVGKLKPDKHYLWLDHYYWHKNINYSKLDEILLGYKKKETVKYNSNKAKLVKCYRSQIGMLFPHGISEDNEEIYEKENKDLFGC